jgi:hypothetical protein
VIQDDPSGATAIDSATSSSEPPIKTDESKGTLGRGPNRSTWMSPIRPKLGGRAEQGGVRRGRDDGRPAQV